MWAMHSDHICTQLLLPPHLTLPKKHPSLPLSCFCFFVYVWFVFWPFEFNQGGLREHGCGAIHWRVDGLPIVRALKTRFLLSPDARPQNYDFTLTRLSLVPSLGRHLKLQCDLQHNSHGVPRRCHSTAFLPNLGLLHCVPPPLTDIPRCLLSLQEMTHMLFLGRSPNVILSPLTSHESLQ